LQDLDEEAREVFYKDLVSECKKANKRFYYSPSQLADIETMQRAREATIRLSYGSCAKYVILPLQDLLGTGATSRMNTPGTLSDRNWSWRYEEDDLKNTLAAKLARMVKKANR
jgi:4-alpha-glucanotransferase